MFYTCFVLNYRVFSGPSLYLLYYLANMGLFALFMLFVFPDFGASFQLNYSSYGWDYLGSAVTTSIELVIIGLSSFILGIGIHALLFSYNPKSKLPEHFHVQREIFYAGLIGVLVCGAIIFGSGRLTILGYLQHFEQMNTSDQRFFYQSLVLICPLFLIALGGAWNRLDFKILAALFFLLLIPIFFAGWRGGPFLTAAIGVIYLFRLVPERSKLFGIIASLFLLSGVVGGHIVGAIREGEAMTESRSALHSGLAMGFSASQQISTVVFTVYEIESGMDYIYGLSYLESMKRIIPNVGLQWIPEQLRASNEFSSLGGWVSRLLHFNNREETWGGISYSGVAEAYINFGYFGVFFTFLFIGFLLGFLDRKSLSSSFWMAMYLTGIMFLMGGTIKGEIILVIRAAVFVFLWAYLCNKVFGNKRRLRVNHPAPTEYSFAQHNMPNHH